MKLSVIDTETTGDGPQDQVCELGVVSVDHHGDDHVVVDSRWSTLLRPSVPVDPRARAVHHITDAELAGAWSMAEMLERRGIPELGIAQLATWQEGDPSPTMSTEMLVEIMVGHNLDFDARMLMQTELEAAAMPLPSRRICTWRCAMHLWQDAPSHKLQVLRYWLSLDEAFIRMPSVVPHRALFDANVCAALLLRMLTFNTVEELERLTTAPVLLTTVRFGEHEGRAWSQVPYSYLQWIVRQGPEQPRVDGRRKRGWDPDTLHTATHHMRLCEERWRQHAPPPEQGPGGGQRT